MFKIGLLFVLIFSGYLVLRPQEGACAPGDPCQTVLQRLASGEQLTESSLRSMGFDISRVRNFERAVTRPMTTEAWEAARGGVRRSMDGVRQSTNSMHPPAGTSLRPPSSTLTEVPGGFQIDGHRYIVRTVNGEKRYFQINYREMISHDGTRVSHYASANISEVTASGERINLVAYADSPHIDRLGAKWFHGHDGATSAVVSEIPISGYTESAIPGMQGWARDFVDTLIRAGN